MSLIPYVQKKVIEWLWQHYVTTCPIAQTLLSHLKTPPALDHFAIIDLPSLHTGIATLNQIFSALNYLPQGREYLTEKQNEFMWLAPAETDNVLAKDVAPQVVIADFCLTDLPTRIQRIIQHYTQHITTFPWTHFHQLCGQAYSDHQIAAEQLIHLITHYCQQREWPMPSLKDYLEIKAHNELLAWVLVFGRQVNHFGISIHLLEPFEDLTQFLDFVQDKDSILLNTNGGLIKGGQDKGIAQASTEGSLIKFPHTELTLPGPFIEFVWRFSQKSHPLYWKDYFTGFIGAQANHVIESVYD